MLLVAVSLVQFSCGSLRVSGNKPDQVKGVITEARSYLGVPYKWGGLTRQGLDCSGLVYRSFEKVGVVVPRTTEGLAEAGKRIKLKKVQPGDLLFFALSEKPGKISHVGIVTEKKNGRMPVFIHASTSKGVIEASLNLNYYRKALKQAKRLDF